MSGKIAANREDLSGKKFNRLLAIDAESRVMPTGRRQVYWRCLCDCGTETFVRSQTLKEGKTKSCGCWAKEKLPESYKHGLSQSDEYKIYKDIVRRCTEQGRKSYANYGGRGITCLWTDFESFYEEMGQRPSKRHSIERVDVDGNYCKENCMWTDDLSLQAFNQRPRKSRFGVPGVRSDKDGYGYVVTIGKDNIRYYLGFFTDLKEAALARKEGEIKYYGFNLDWEMPE